jgi:uncharacterized protein involved in type VI secretion and phage assembly
MSILDILDRKRSFEGSPVIATGKVTDNKDPQKQGRVKVRYEWRDKNNESDWIRIMTPMAGKSMGVYFLPEVEDEVLVAFQNGDLDAPVILGSLWSKNIPPPDLNDNEKNDKRMIQSRSGHKIILDDKSGEEKITIVDKSGNNSIVIDSKEKLITITSEKDMKILAENGILTINAKEIAVSTSQGTSFESGADFTVKASSGKASVESMELSLKASSQGTLEASAALNVKASGNTTIKGAMVMIN